MGSCGLQGIVAQIHFSRLWYRIQWAVACRESSLRYTIAARHCRAAAAVACRESSLRYTSGSDSGSVSIAVACRESSLRYTAAVDVLLSSPSCGLQGIVAQIHWLPWSHRVASRLWLAGNRRSDTLRPTLMMPIQELWLAGNRRSDTLAALVASSGEQAVACRESSLRYTLAIDIASSGVSCGLQGIVAQIHFKQPIAMIALELWLAGNRRSDTLHHRGQSSPPRCGLQGIVAQIHSHAVRGLQAHALWLAGNRRSDTLQQREELRDLRLWLAGNRRSDTLAREPTPRHFALWLAGNRRSDTLTVRRGIVNQAVACRESSLRYTSAPHFLPSLFAVACRESSLRYTSDCNSIPCLELWLAGNRRSDTLKPRCAYMQV